jgi:mannose-6-phosphate isomerase-like protein (cupin superfamily)
MNVQNLNRVTSFTTKDGSEIRELLAHRNSSIRNQSLAEARLPPGASTTLHYHPRAEEIYYILSGQGLMRLEPETMTVGPGDAVAIPPGRIHQITNTGNTTLIFLCCCAPGYEHDDTILVDP